MRKYKDFINAATDTPLFESLPIKQKRLSRSKISRKVKDCSPNVVAEIARSGRDVSIRYAYDGFNKVYQFNSKNLSAFPPLISAFYKLRRINSRNILTHGILSGIIEHQRLYLETGDSADLVPLSQVELAGVLSTRCSLSGASKATLRGLPANSIDNSWISRLVNRLSVITPSGEEKPLKCFFQTQKDINKRFIKQLLDKESEDLQSGKLKTPYTDTELKEKLEAVLRAKSPHPAGERDRVKSPLHFGERVRVRGKTISRWTVGHCRKDMGIPPAKRRLSGYKYPPLSANFSMLYPLVLEEVLRCAPSSPGIYEFRLKGKEIEYPNGKTHVIYIGSTKNIRKRLREHLGKNSKNGKIRTFLKKSECSFRYILFKKDWQKEEKGLYRLFMDTYGSPPTCNRVRP